ncbi:MAG: hypothetical protein ACQGVC_21985 [Myxococcota bacterium]
MPQPTVSSAGLGSILRALRAALLAAALAACPGAAAAQDGDAAPSVCAPLHAAGDGHPDLQQLFLASCRALAGDAVGEPGGLASRLRVRVGGWLDTSYLDNDIDGRGASFDLDHANLYLDARLDERWQVFVEGEYEHERDLTGLPDEREFELEQGYLEYVVSDALKLRGGKFAAPIGYWTPVHWSVNVDTIEVPIHEATRMVPEQQLGGRVHGSLFPDWLAPLEPTIDYSLALGYGADRLGTGKPDGLNGGLDLRLWSAGRHLLAFSYYAQENGELQDREEHNFMLYGQVALPANLLLRSEYLHQDRSDRPGYTRNADVVYAKLRWDFHRRAYFNYRFQFGQDDRYGFTADHTIHTLTLGWRPIPRVIGKLETAFHDLDDGIESYVAWGASLGVLF